MNVIFISGVECIIDELYEKKLEIHKKLEKLGLITLCHRANVIYKDLLPVTLDK